MHDRTYLTAVFTGSVYSFSYHCTARITNVVRSFVLINRLASLIAVKLQYELIVFNLSAHIHSLSLSLSSIDFKFFSSKHWEIMLVIGSYCRPNMKRDPSLFMCNAYCFTVGADKISINYITCLWRNMGKSFGILFDETYKGCNKNHEKDRSLFVTRYHSFRVDSF